MRTSIRFDSWRQHSGALAVIKRNTSNPHAMVNVIDGVVSTKDGLVRVYTEWPLAGFNKKPFTSYTYSVRGRTYRWCEDRTRSERGLALKAHTLVRGLFAGRYNKPGRYAR